MKNLSSTITAVLLVALGLVAGCAKTDTTPQEIVTYRLTVYNDGSEVLAIDGITSYSSGDARLYVTAPGSVESTVIGGHFVLEPDGFKEANRSDARYKVDLFSGGQAVRSWYINKYAVGDGKIYIYGESGKQAVVGGDYVLTPLR